ncbi:MAG: site-specific integrase [Alphaproteobacteria bacterium]
MDDLVFVGRFDSPVSPHLRSYLRAAVSDNTCRAYRADLRHFLDWGGAIPATDVMVAEYLAAYASALAVATLERRLATIGKLHTVQGLPSPTASPLVRTTMRGIRRTHGRPQRRVAAAPIEDILAMVARMGDRPKDIRDLALLLVGFAGAFRRSELVAINCNDVAWHPEEIVITVRRSKTDTAGRVDHRTVSGSDILTRNEPVTSTGGERRKAGALTPRPGTRSTTRERFSDLAKAVTSARAARATAPASIYLR